MTFDEMKQSLIDLNYAQGKSKLPENFHEMLTIYYKALKFIDATTFREGVSALMRQEFRGFPSTGILIEACHGVPGTQNRKECEFCGGSGWQTAIKTFTHCICPVDNQIIKKEDCMRHGYSTPLCDACQQPYSKPGIRVEYPGYKNEKNELRVAIR